MMVYADKLSWPTMINNVEATKNDQPLSWWTRSRDNCLLLVQAKKLVFDPISCVSSVQLVMVGINISLSRYCCCNGRVFRGEEGDYWNLLSQPLCATFHKCGIQSTLVPQHSLINSSLAQSEHELYSLFTASESVTTEASIHCQGTLGMCLITVLMIERCWQEQWWWVLASMTL